MTKRHLGPFLTSCFKATPFTMACFNIAGHKSYNDALGHVEGDRAIVQLQALMARHLEQNAFVRVNGASWLARMQGLSPANAIADGFVQTTARRLGWTAHASRGGEQATSCENAKAYVHRRVRCLYADISHAFEVQMVADKLLEGCTGFAPRSPVNLANLDSVLAGSWSSVTRESIPQPYCPFCKGTKFIWTGGDGSSYGRDGDCQCCGANVSFSNTLDP